MTVATSASSLAVLTTTIGIVLTSVGLRKGLLRPRPGPRRCPSCGRRLRGWTCWACAHVHEE